MSQPCRSEITLQQGNRKLNFTCWLVEDHEYPHECPLEGINNEGAQLRWVGTYQAFPEDI